MEISTWLIYVSVISLLILTPGPSALLCISDGLKFGKKNSIATVLGGAIAALVLMTVSAAGLGALLVASEKLFFVLKILGAMYLIYIGWKSWCDSGSAELFRDSNFSVADNFSYLSLFKKGFMVGISNPKDLLFFTALFPGFIDMATPHFEQYTILASTWFVVDCSSMFMYAILGYRFGPWLSNAKNIRYFNRVVGGVFMSLGSSLAFTAGASR
ncbi:LysE family translocator [Vibrio salinus]|uniref:LysE family translocator n=1 Tax=Vibrio salinus TaxID=2899784 RepID=UPI001E485E0C|nr:LysE family translocator [Vibrio salinus]MCE0494875.1 LysE family translocator [Vibrio salinus]